MKNFLLMLLIISGLAACNDAATKDNFTVTGEIKNLPDQNIYLEQIYFSQQAPEILDTAIVKNGKFSLSGIAAEEGLFRLRMEKSGSGFVFINDKPSINFRADIKDISLLSTRFNTPANMLLKNLMVKIEAKINALNASSERLQESGTNDSIQSLETARHDALSDDFKNFITGFADTVSDPVVGMFALGFTKDPGILAVSIPALAKRFPKHKGIASLANGNQQNEQAANKPGAAQGNTAPDFTMNDTEGKPFSLSSLKGKYVLVDFWASWCGPCRGENPNVAAAYNKYKDKNFTVLGVSLDEDKTAWLAAIVQDNLTWKHVSDLKGWSSAAVALYGFQGIPYNVLLDPEGKIIAAELRGAELEGKLAEVLK